MAPAGTGVAPNLRMRMTVRCCYKILLTLSTALTVCHSPFLAAAAIPCPAHLDSGDEFREDLEKLQLKTNRLRLIPFRNDQLEDIYAIYKNPEILKWNQPEAPKDIVLQIEEGSSRDLKTLKSSESPKVRWAIYKDTQLIGFTGMRTIFKEPNELIPDQSELWVSIAYAILPEHWGHGYATEAQIRVNEFLFSHLNVVAIRAITMKGNEPSAGLLEKLGFNKNDSDPNYDLFYLFPSF